MMKYFYIALAIALSTGYKCHAQNSTINTPAAGVVSSDTFTYNTYAVSNYGLGWYRDPNTDSPPAAYLSAYNGIKFFTLGAFKMIINPSGNVGIGIVNPQNKLDVNGTIHSKSVLIDLVGWSDYVFNKDYSLRPLSEVKSYVDTHQHLPEMPSEQEMVKNGLDVAEMNKLLMKKVEELTLYMIERENKEKELQEQVDQLKEQVKSLAAKP